MWLSKHSNPCHNGFKCNNFFTKNIYEKRGIANSSHFVPVPEFDFFKNQNVSFNRDEKEIEEMNKLMNIKNMIEKSKKLLVVTGAGISTESGVPDYRSPNGSYSKGHKPTLYQDFVKCDFKKKRFWFRSMVYYKFTYNRVSPNNAHYLLKKFEDKGKIHGLITQNVDGLHFKVNQRHCIELHGNLRTTSCLNCKRVYERKRVQEYLEEKNAALIDLVSSIKTPKDVENIRSDGDFNLENLTEEDINQFHLPYCFDHCGESAKLKPSVVFFGESVPRSTMDQVDELLESSDALLVLGTSLQVYSSYRIARKLRERGQPVGIISIGPTRADPIASYKLEQICSDSLEYIYRSLYPNESLPYL